MSELALADVTPDPIMVMNPIELGRVEMAGATFVTCGEGPIVRIDADGSRRPLDSGCDRLGHKLWRHGIAHVDGVLFATQYAMSKFGAHDGEIIAIDERGEPSLVLDGFHKPIGLAKCGPDLVVADARARALYRIELVAGRARARYLIASFDDRPEAFAACDGGSVYVATYDAPTHTGCLLRVGLDGMRTELARGAWQPSSITVTPEAIRVATGDGVVLVTV